MKILSLRAGRLCHVWTMVALSLGWGPASAQPQSDWSIMAEEGACWATYTRLSKGLKDAASTHGFRWLPGQGIEWLILETAPEGTKKAEPISLKVLTANGTRLAGLAEHVVLDDLQSYVLTTADRKDVTLLISGDLTFSYTGGESRPVSVTIPLAQQLPRIRNCMAEARVQTRKLAASGGEPAAALSSEAKTSAEPRLLSTGSGVFVNAAGQLLTNAHVVDGCSAVGNATLGVARVTAIDAASDLALLQFEQRPRGHVKIRPTTLRLGESVLAAGFPLSNVLENGLNITGGNVSALAGQGGDRRFVQFTAPVQPGNSGGPLLDASGRLAGLVVARLDPETATATAAQNINYAVAPFIVQAFLQEHGVTYAEGREARETPESIAAKAKGYTVPLQCWG